MHPRYTVCTELFNGQLIYVYFLTGGTIRDIDTDSTCSGVEGRDAVLSTRVVWVTSDTLTL